MTLRMPGVQYVGPPDSNWSNGEVRPPNGMVVHIAEGSLWGTVGWQQNPASDVSSYFVIGRDGTILQMLDLDLMAWTQAGGNPNWIGVENEGFSTQGFTDAQVTANARVFAWIVSVWPSVGYQVVNSPGAFGLGWHGMGGAAWGNHPNCPGSINVAKLPAIAAQARQINEGGNPLPPIPGWDEGDEMHFAREPNGSVWWVGIGIDPVSGRPYRRGGFDPFTWGRWEKAGFQTVQLSEPMNANDWVTLPAAGPAVAATCDCAGGGGSAPSAEQVAEAVANELHARLES